MFPFAAVASSVKRLKVNNKKRKKKVRKLDNVSKEQFYKWQSEGKCGMCGEPSGEYEGICDPCRFS